MKCKIPESMFNWPRGDVKKDASRVNRARWLHRLVRSFAPRESLAANFCGGDQWQALGTADMTSSRHDWAALNLRALKQPTEIPWKGRNSWHCIKLSEETNKPKLDS